MRTVKHIFEAKKCKTVRDTKTCQIRVIRTNFHRLQVAEPREKARRALAKPGGRVLSARPKGDEKKNELNK